MAVVLIETPSGTGSGFFFDDDGHILTNAHVVESYNTVTVRYNDIVDFEATVVNTHEASDLAVIKVDALLAFENVSLGDSVNLEVSSLIYAPDPAVVGNLVLYEAIVRNTGITSATNVVVNVTIPFGNEFYSASVQGGSCALVVLGLITCDLGTMSPGVEVGTLVQVRLRPIIQGSSRVSFSIRSDEDDHDPDDNTRVVFSAANRPFEPQAKEPAEFVPIETESGSVVLVLPGAAGVVESGDGLVRLELPANEGGAPVVVRVQVVPVSSVPVPLVGLISRYALVEFFNIIGLPITDYASSAPAQTTFFITDSELVSIGGSQGLTREHSRGTRGILRFDEAQNRWVVEETLVGADSGIRTTGTSAFRGTKTYYAMIWNPNGLLTDLELTSAPAPVTTTTPTPVPTSTPLPPPDPAGTPEPADPTPTPAPTQTPLPTPDIGPTSTPLPTPDIGPTSTPLPSPFETPEAPVGPPAGGSSPPGGGAGTEVPGPPPPIFTIDAWSELFKWLGLAGGVVAVLGTSGYLLVTKGARYGGAAVLATGLFILVMDRLVPVAMGAAETAAVRLGSLWEAAYSYYKSVLSICKRIWAAVPV